MGKRKKRSWPGLPEPLAGSIIGNHTHLPVHEGEIPGADGPKLFLDEQLSRAKATNIVGVISSAYEIPSSNPTMWIVCTYEGVRVVVAIHLNEAALYADVTKPSPDGLVLYQAAHHVPLDEAIAKVERPLKDPLAIIVGENGLDYFRTTAQGYEAQKRSSAAHLELGVEADLSVQIHDRGARADTLEALADVVRADQPVVFHCFSDDAHLARALAEKDWYVSFVDPLACPANEDLRAALITILRKLVFVETDTPYLTPMSHRGSPNAPYVMAHTV